jgi:formyltetrahydrofolate-dependent phosphoribosylglycinamide formyltransferase
MVNKIKACVFISGNGSNLKSIIKNSRDYNFPIKIELIISNNIKANGLKIAKKYSIPYKYFSTRNKKLFERNSLFEVKKRNIKFLCLAGFMKVLSNNFIKSFHHKIINIHPSLLPKYKGLGAHERVLKNKEKYSGCTVHYVTSELDSGKIILQKRIRIGKNETAHSLKLKILKQEHVLYPKSIISVFK